MGNFIDNTKLVLISDDDYNFTCNHIYEEIEKFGGIYSEEWKSLDPLFDDEVWKNCKSINLSKYYVSNYGRVLKASYDKIIERKNTSSYVLKIPAEICIGISNDNTKYYHMVSVHFDDSNHKSVVPAHRIVCFMFSQSKPNSFKYNKTKTIAALVDHKDANRMNNICSNLHFVTPKENMNNVNTIDKFKNKNKLVLTDDLNGPASSDDDVEKFNYLSKRWYETIDFKNEIWKTFHISKINEIVTEVSNYGRIRKTTKNKSIITMSKPMRGYLNVRIGNKTYAIHRLVALLFLDMSNIPTPENYFVDHIDGIRHHNVFYNLRWTTRIENMNNSITRERIKQNYMTHAIKYKIAMYLYSSGDFVEMFDSIKDAAEKTHINEGRISQNIQGINSFSYNIEENQLYVFRDVTTASEELIKQNLYESELFYIKDMKYSLDDIKSQNELYGNCWYVNAYNATTGEFIKQFRTIKEVSDEYNTTNTMICEILIGKIKTLINKGKQIYYTFRKINYSNTFNFENLYTSGLFQIWSKEMNIDYFKRIYCSVYKLMLINCYDYYTGDFIKQYDTVNSAANDLKLNQANMSKHIKDETKCITRTSDNSKFVLRFVKQEYSKYSIGKNLKEFNKILQCDISI